MCGCRYFDPFRYGEKYNRTAELNMTYKLHQTQSSQLLRPTGSTSNERYRHSFRFSIRSEKQNGYKFIKDVITSNITISDLIDFQNGNYYKPGVINAYLRLLDTYFEYDLSK